MKKTLVTGMVVALVAGCMLAPATAAKKKPKKPKPPVVVSEQVQTDVNYYLRRSACEGAPEETTLSIVDGPDEEGDECGSVETGIATEVMETTGQNPPAVPGVVDLGPDRSVWNATDGIPLVLDATKDITGRIELSSFCCEPDVPVGTSAGKAKLHALVTGTVDGTVKTVGETTVEYDITPASSVFTVEFSIKPDVALDKLTFTTLELTLTNRGASFLNGFYSVDDPASLITLGTWQ